MRVITVPGVFQPRSDTWMLIGAVREHAFRGARVLDLCTGSGAIGVAAALRGAAVTAVDVSRRALLSAWLNGRVNGVRVRTRHGNLFSAVEGERFDVIAVNPPYLPAPRDELPDSGPERAWDAGRDGRALLDPICAQAPAHLAPGGALLVLQSTMCDLDRTEAALAAQGLEVDVVLRHRGELGPIMRARAPQLWEDGHLTPGSFEEEIVIVRGRAPDRRVTMAKDHGSSVKDDKQYEGLRKKGMSKSRAARIANSPDASSKGGKASGGGKSNSDSSQGGTKAQKAAAGRKGGKKSS
ncbi:MAG: release factor glutamine methyltransferase [Solirubrobacteraceae bacterium]|jgi:release factor glutamine methyltransferase|nr:release factor glutamine methyltransferase [Solirubrobacteraceae bacterium]